MAHPDGQCVDFIVHDSLDGDKLHLLLGPTLPQQMAWPTIVDWGAMTLLSFGKEFDVVLSTSEAGWSFAEPPQERLCLMLADDRLYLRANYSRHVGVFRSCYIAIESGQILSAGGQYARPQATAAFATDWAFMTREQKPRTIFSTRQP